MSMTATRTNEEVPEVFRAMFPEAASSALLEYFLTIRSMHDTYAETVAYFERMAQDRATMVTAGALRPTDPDLKHIVLEDLNNIRLFYQPSTPGHQHSALWDFFLARPGNDGPTNSIMHNWEQEGYQIEMCAMDGEWIQCGSKPGLSKLVAPPFTRVRISKNGAEEELIFPRSLSDRKMRITLME